MNKITLRDMIHAKLCDYRVDLEPGEMNELADDLDELVARELGPVFSHKPPSDKGLLEELKKWSKMDYLSWVTFDEILSRHEAEQGEGLGEQIVCAGCGHGDFYLNTSGMMCCKACGKQRSETVGIYSGNCRFNVGVCILPEKEPCRMGFISRCHGRIGKNPTPDKAVEPEENKPTVCFACNNSNGKSDEWCACYVHDESEQFCILKSRLTPKARAYLMALEDKEGV